MFSLLMNWILPLFPATPLLGPILNPIDSFQSWQFPLFLFVPALIIDIVVHRKLRNDWIRALIIGPAFILLLLVIHWNFGDFLMSEGARNWVFGQESWYFGNSPDWEYRYKFPEWNVSSGSALFQGVAIAIGIAILTSRLGLYFGKWMKRVQR